MLGWTRRRSVMTHRPQANKLLSLLDQIAAELRDAPALSDEAVSRAGIYAEDVGKGRANFASEATGRVGPSPLGGRWLGTGGG